MSDQWQIIIKYTSGTETAVPLDKPSLVLGRPDPSQDWKPDIDLGDPRVSRRHARLLNQAGAWTLQDLGSSHGTLVGQAEIQSQNAPTVVAPGMPVQMGDTIWVLQPPASQEQFRLEIDHPPAINYSVHHCGFPVIKALTIRNNGHAFSSPLNLAVEIHGYSRVWRQTMAPIPPGETVTLPPIHLNLNYDRLAGLDGRESATLTVSLNDRLLVEHSIEMLGFYEFSFHPDFRRSIACFVQPAHPLVQNIVLEARSFLPEPEMAEFWGLPWVAQQENGAAFTLRAIYDCLRDYYQLEYVLAPPSYQADSQVIRPPHRVVQDVRARRGQGTCIDLALLLAACLESLNLQPLVIFLQGTGCYHVLLGCWRQVSPRLEPILKDYDRLRRYVTDHLLLLEATGVARSGLDGKLTWQQARAKAQELFQAENFLFAVDIAAARQTVTPLQFPMYPGVIKIIREAAVLARTEGSAKLETRHLLASLIRSGASDRLGEVLQEAGLDTGAAAPAATTAPRNGSEAPGSTPHPTLNYRRVLEDARLIAADLSQGFVATEHLLYALLLSQSPAVDRLLAARQSSRQQLKSIFEDKFPWHQEISQTIVESE